MLESLIQRMDPKVKRLGSDVLNLKVMMNSGTNQDKFTTLISPIAQTKLLEVTGDIQLS